MPWSSWSMTPVLIKQLDHHKVAQGANKGGWIDLGTRKWASFTSLSWTLRNCLGPWYPMFEQSPNPCSKDGSLAFRSKWMTKTWHCGRWRIHGWAARPIQPDPASYAVAWNQMVVVSWWSWSWWSCHVTDRGPLGYEVKLQSNCACLGRKKLADSYRFGQRHLSGIKSVLWFFEKLENHRLWMRFKLPLYFLFQHLQMFVPSNSLRSQPKAVQNHGWSASRLTLADHSSEACCWTEILHLYLDPKILGIPTR